MKRKNIILIFAVLFIGICIVIHFTAPSIFTNLIIANYSEEYVRKIDLTDVKSISVSNNGQKYTAEKHSEKYNNVVSALDNKKVKIKTDTVRFQEKNRFQIDIVTNEKSFTFNASPMLENGELQKKIELVLYDGTNYNTMEYKYFIVEITKEDFLKIFPDAVIQMNDEIKQANS